MAITGTFAQGDEVSFNDCVVEVDTAGGTSWVEINSWATTATITTGRVPITETYPFTSDVVITVGNKPMDSITVECLYTEDSTDPFENIYDVWEAGPGASFSVRVTPAGSGGGQVFTLSAGKLVSCTPPSAQGDGVSPSVFTFEVVGSSVALTQA
jgi:hypothetical protein